MAYKYFRYPGRFAVFHDEPQTCEVCHNEKTCLEASSFYCERELEAVCEDCLKAGRLGEINAYTNDGDVEQLFDQMEALYPDKAKQALLKEAKAKTDELEMRTPPLVSWQEWKFPAMDGDYCEFVGFGSKTELNKLATDGDGKQLLVDSLLDELREVTNIDAIWRTIPEKRIKNVAQSNDHPLLVYIFKSRHSEKYVMVWDMC